MIPCTDFIPAYSELFKYLESRGGPEAVLDFWNHLSDSFLTNLRDLVTEHGLRGHCDVLYRRVLEPLGFECIADMSGCDEARCSFVVRPVRQGGAP